MGRSCTKIRLVVHSNLTHPISMKRVLCAVAIVCFLTGCERNAEFKAEQQLIELEKELANNEQDINMRLPNAESKNKNINPHPLQISIADSGAIYLGRLESGVPMDKNPDERELPLLSRELRAYTVASEYTGLEATVLLNISKKATQQRIIDVLNCITKFGIRQVTYEDLINQTESEILSQKAKVEKLPQPPINEYPESKKTQDTKARITEALPFERIFINILSDGSIKTADGVPIDTDEAIQDHISNEVKRIKDLNGEPVIYLRGNKEHFKYTKKVVMNAQKVGVTDIRFSAFTHDK